MTVIVGVVGETIFFRVMKKDMLVRTDGHLCCLRLEQVRHTPSSKFPESKHASLPHIEVCGGHMRL